MRWVEVRASRSFRRARRRVGSSEVEGSGTVVVWVELLGLELAFRLTLGVQVVLVVVRKVEVVDEKGC